jgi:nitrate reductase NapD
MKVPGTGACNHRTGEENHVVHHRNRGQIPHMNISGILVIVSPQRVESTVERLNRLDGIDVHHIDAATGRIVITQEAGSIREEVEGLKRIRALPGIILAEMSYHNFEDDTELLQGIPAELDEENLDAARVPEYLNR